MMNNYSNRIEYAKRVLPELQHLQKIGLICKSGENFPSIVYPPITRYKEQAPEDLYAGYTFPKDGKIDIYVHFPFCEQRCVFCHYPVKIGENSEEKEKYLNTMKQEIKTYMRKFNLSRITPRSILFGGGTPTYMSPAMLEDFLKFFCEVVDVSKATQFSFDVDPNTLIGDHGKERLQIMRDHGVTRLTIGVQSFNDDVLKYMARPHNAVMALESVYAAKEMGFELNIDLIYGHPGQTFENWIETTKKAAELSLGEIQLYRLKVQAYGDYQGAIINMKEATPDFVSTMLMKRLAIDILAEYGYKENLRRVYTKSKNAISHHAFNQCCNLLEQIGFGLTAYTSYRDRFMINTQHFSDYYSSIENGILPANRGLIRNKEQQIRWSIVLPLKNNYIIKKRFEDMHGIPLDQVFRKKFERLKNENLIQETDTMVSLTTMGAFISDEVVEQFYHNDYQQFAPGDFEDGDLHPYKDNTTLDAFGLLEEN